MAEAKLLINPKALPLCGNKNLAFDKLEIISRNQRKVKSKLLKIKDIKS